MLIQPAVEDSVNVRRGTQETSCRRRYCDVEDMDDLPNRYVYDLWK